MASGVGLYWYNLKTMPVAQRGRARAGRVATGDAMARCGSRACWFGLGVVLGAAVGGACAMLVRTAAEQRVLRQHDATLVPSDPAADQALTDTATDVVEYGGFVIHVYCHALGMGRFKALCDIWESGAWCWRAARPRPRTRRRMMRVPRRFHGRGNGCSTMAEGGRRAIIAMTGDADARL